MKIDDAVKSWHKILAGLVCGKNCKRYSEVYSVQALCWGSFWHSGGSVTASWLHSIRFELRLLCMCVFFLGFPSSFWIPRFPKNLNCLDIC